MPTRYTCGNSSPFAACSVISVTASPLVLRSSLGSSPVVSASSSRKPWSDGLAARRTWFSAKLSTSTTPAQRASRVVGSG